MKRSKKACLTIMASVTLVSGCTPEPTVQAGIFNNTEECAAYYNKAICEQEQRTAKAVHQQVAPRYSSEADCKADFDRCETSSSGGGFIPMMTGYMMGYNPVGGQSNVYERSFQSTPLYKSKDDKNTYRTATNVPVASGGAGFINTTRSSVSQYSTPAGNVNRGGFGAQAAARSTSSSSSYGG
jgi:uncharacterized protein YgiB involved in biofilm formation